MLLVRFINFITRFIFIFIQRVYVFFFNNRGHDNIYMFHKVNDNDNDEYTINTQKFEHFVEKNKNSINSIENLEKSGGIVLSFDDAYEDVYYNVRPILNKYNCVYYVFLCNEFIDKKGYLNVSQIKELINDGNCVICSHLSNHEISRFCSEDILENSILRSKEYLYKTFGIDNDYMAFPYGSIYAVSRKNVSIASKYFKYIFSTIPVSYNGSKVFGMYPRINVNNKSYL